MLHKKIKKQTQLIPKQLIPGALVFVSIGAPLFNVSGDLGLGDTSEPTIGLIVTVCFSWDKVYFNDVIMLHPTIGLVRTYASYVKAIDL